jgi:TfoX/Sxy family transcriptional regulator of competence genes
MDTDDGAARLRLPGNRPAAGAGSVGAMAYDEALAERIRDRLHDTDGVTEKKMFGGLAFLAHGNMAVGVIGDDLIVRVGPDATDAALTHPGARAFDMTGRPMKGWIVVDGAVLDDDVLAGWIRQGETFAGTLPPK